MTLTFEQLRSANLSTLSEAVDSWRNLPGKFDTIARSFGTTVTKGLQDSDWKGETATEALEKFSHVERQMKAAADEAHDVHELLKSALETFQAAKDELKAIERYVHEDKNLKITSEGHVYCDPPEEHRDQSAALQKAYLETVHDCNNRIKAALTDASNADTALHWALTMDANGDKKGFNTTTSGSIKEAQKGRKEALREAHDMAALARKGNDLSITQVQRMTKTFAKYEGDPLFNEEFATTLGSKGTLQFWANVTDSYAGAKGSELNHLKQLQNNLSTTLANASQSHSPEMERWKKEIIEAGNMRIESDPTAPMQVPSRSLGFQVMSSLMSHGNYDTDFLNDYRKELLKMDKAGGAMHTDKIWEGSYLNSDLVFGDGNGRDPLIGFMGALSHNPEAATDAFSSKSDLNHLLESSKYTDRGNSLGHSLEVAVTGLARGEIADREIPHSKTQVEIMSNIMHAVAQPNGGAELVDSAIGDSFGRMASAYMPEISRAMAGPGAESVFVTNSAAPEGLERTDVTRFLYEVAQDKDGNAAIRYGEGIYTSSLLEAHIANPSLYDGRSEKVIEDIAQNAGIIQGVVGRSTADSGILDSLEGEKEYNESLKKQGDFVKTILSTGIGVGAVALVPTSAVVGAAAGGFFSGISGMAVDRLYEGRELDGALDEALYRTGQDLNKTQDSVTQQTQWSALDAIAAHDSDLAEGSTKNSIRDAVNRGWLQSDTILEESHQRPSA
ncbi:hypothetical protein JIX56_11695 [Streptomyces sp. CA-210063]|uniref:hypothetical protein n=1 Tax=Streptomyces sp. CA-210063 TaxID=2801029 RepID=UPI00214AFC01|nr:hypothetical protein [Streptomyces sp. CA-210063]UUU30512.1 hypothetical protein JIX56_11695 [Streptomyces sp. CA-210063]